MDEPVVNEYASSLSELTTNSKPLISMLTILADENKAQAAKIAQVIQNYLEKSSPKVKLLSLYLIDSIIKNVREPYITIFTENIVSMFTEVFEGGDEKVRTALFKLRQTWKGIFSESKLYLVDISTKRMDPRWPITTSSESLRAPIHLNPKFFLRQTNGIQDPKLNPATISLNENLESEKTSHNKRQSHHEEAHKSDEEQNKILKDNTDAEKRSDPRLKKKDNSEKKSSSKSMPRHEDSLAKSRTTSRSSSRSSSLKSEHKRRDAGKRPSEEFSPPPTASSLEPSLADKEAAAIFTGDVDLRLLGPQTKKRKEETSILDEFPAADVDLRIRPTLVPESTESTSAIKVEPKAETEDDDDLDKAAQWAKVKGTSLSYSTEPVISKVAPNGNRPPPARVNSNPSSVMPLQPDVSSLFGERSSKPTNVLPEVGASTTLKSKSVRISDPAPDSGQIRLDNRMREVRFVDGVAVAIIEEMPPNFVRARQIMFRGGTKKIIINDTIEVLAAFDGREHEFNLNGNRHRVRFGAPLRELYIDGIPYACQFNGIPIYVRSREDVFSVTLHPPCPSVNDKMEGTPELLNKLGLKPLLPNPSTPFLGGPFPRMHPIPGRLPMNGTNSGGWIRYQDEIRTPANLPPSGIYPPMSTNIGPLAQYPGFSGNAMFCPPPHLGAPRYGAYPPPPLLPPSNLGMSSIPTPLPSVPSAVPANTPAPAVPQVNVSDLLSKLVNAGIIGSGEKSEPAADIKPKDSTVEEIPKLSFKQTDALKKLYSGVITALHDGMQCATCGQRFTQAEKSSDKYAQHLDWHFRSARREREGLKKASSRKWFYDIPDWIQFEEVEDIDDRARSYFEIQEAPNENSSQEKETMEDQELPTVSAKNVDQNENACFLCHEAFELFFCEETEEWRLRNAVIYNGKVFHPNCYEDFIRPAPEVAMKKEDSTAAESAEVKMEHESKEEPFGTKDDETSQPLPGLDFAPPSVKETQKENEHEEKMHPGEETENIPELETLPLEEPMETEGNRNDLNDTVQDAEQTVIVEELGEFGVNNSDVKEDSVVEENDDDESTRFSGRSVDLINGPSSVQSPENTSQDSQPEAKVIVKSSGGIVLKVNHERAANGDSKLVNTSVVEDAEPEPEDTWTPPTPDPAYKNCALVKKGTEESGLCSIM